MRIDYPVIFSILLVFVILTHMRGCCRRKGLSASSHTSQWGHHKPWGGSEIFVGRRPEMPFGQKRARARERERERKCGERETEEERGRGRVRRVREGGQGSLYPPFGFKRPNLFSRQLFWRLGVPFSHSAINADESEGRDDTLMIRNNCQLSEKESDRWLGYTGVHQASMSKKSFNFNGTCWNSTVWLCHLLFDISSCFCINHITTKWPFYWRRKTNLHLIRIRRWSICHCSLTEEVFIICFQERWLNKWNLKFYWHCASSI